MKDAHHRGVTVCVVRAAEYWTKAGCMPLGGRDGTVGPCQTGPERSMGRGDLAPLSHDPGPWCGSSSKEEAVALFCPVIYSSYKFHVRYQKTKSQVNAVMRSYNSNISSPLAISLAT